MASNGAFQGGHRRCSKVAAAVAVAPPTRPENITTYLSVVRTTYSTDTTRSIHTKSTKSL